MCTWSYDMLWRGNNDWTSGDGQDWSLIWLFHWNIWFWIFPVYFYFLILLVMTNIGLRLCFYMYEVIFTMSASVNIISSYALGRRFLSVLYKKEYIIQYCKINFTNLLVKKFKSSIIFYFSAQLKNDSLRDLDPNGK